MENSIEGHKKLKIEPSYGPKTFTSGNISKGKTLIKKIPSFTYMFIVALFTIAKTWKQPK